MVAKNELVSRKDGNQNPFQASLPVTSTPTAGDVLDLKKRKKRKKRVRGQKAKIRVVAAIGEGPRERKLGKGQVREFDILRKGKRNADVPRKARELMARVARMRGDTSGVSQVISMAEARGDGGQERKVGDQAGGGREGRAGRQKKEKRAGENVSAADAVMKAKTGPKEKRFEGMQQGENFAQFSTRLRKEAKKMRVDVAKKGNHQREKKRAYYEKRKEVAVIRKKKRQGGGKDVDVEEEDYHEGIAHLPGYWQEIVRNHGRPISEKQRKRMNRSLKEEDSDNVAFGEHVERPPQLSVLPVRRGRQVDK